MTPEQVRAEVAKIEAMRGDDEAAHSAEDGLWLDVLKAIAKGECADPAAVAAEAIKTNDIDFSRWCA